jgi:hypothetical protein
VRVKDRGIGIAPEELDGIFRRFRRAQRRIHERRGLGLGLPVAKAIVEAHKGSIAMQSRLGEGAIVTVTFLPGPQSTKPLRPRPRRAKPCRPAARGRHVNVLLVEDRPASPISSTAACAPKTTA